MHIPEGASLEDSTDALWRPWTIVKQAPPCFDENSAATLHLAAQVRKEHEHTETVSEKRYRILTQTCRHYTRYTLLLHQFPIRRNDWLTTLRAWSWLSTTRSFVGFNVSLHACLQLGTILN